MRKGAERFSEACSLMPVGFLRPLTWSGCGLRGGIRVPRRRSVTDSAGDRELALKFFPGPGPSGCSRFSALVRALVNSNDVVLEALHSPCLFSGRMGLFRWVRTWAAQPRPRLCLRGTPHFAM